MYMEFVRKLLEAYTLHCKPLCRELNLPQTAFDILMFLANNPDCSSARDIVEVRGVRPNLVSVNVDKLVQEGYLTRETAPGDRRKILLRCTEKATPVIARGRSCQSAFRQAALQGIGPAELQALSGILQTIRRNVDRLMEEAP